jgi:hypothetical protein
MKSFVIDLTLGFGKTYPIDHERRAVQNFESPFCIDKLTILVITTIKITVT